MTGVIAKAHSANVTGRQLPYVPDLVVHCLTPRSRPLHGQSRFYPSANAPGYCAPFFNLLYRESFSYMYCKTQPSLKLLMK